MNYKPNLFVSFLFPCFLIPATLALFFWYGMNLFTEDPSALVEMEKIVSATLPRVLLDIIFDYFRWDWPCPGEEVAAMDSAGDWYQALVCRRTCDFAFFHYYGWKEEQFDEWISRRGETVHPHRDNITLYDKNLFPKLPFPASAHDELGLLFPRLRKIAEMAAVGTWQRDTRYPPPLPRNKVDYFEKHRYEVKLCWRPNTAELF